MSEFQDIIAEIAEHTLLTMDRLWALYSLSRHSSLLPGDMAEVGVYKGGSSVLLARANPDKIVHAFDTFTGIPNADANEVHANGDFDVGGKPPAILACCANIIPRVGLFPDTASFDATYCFAHFDGDTYPSCRAFIDYFTPRMSRGGAMVFDDYGWFRCPGVKRALHETFDERRILSFASVQAIVFV